MVRARAHRPGCSASAGGRRVVALSAVTSPTRGSGRGLTRPPFARRPLESQSRSSGGIFRMYRWWVFVHVVGVFGFLVSHGVSMYVTFELRGTRDPKRMVSLLELSGSSVRAFYWSFGVLLAGGVVAGFLGHWG